MKRKGSTIQVVEQRTELVDIDSIRPHEANCNQGDVGSITGSIQENGFYGSVIAQESSGKILAGEHRWRAMKLAGADKIPVTFVDVDDQAAVRILLADNRTTRLGIDDPVKLAELLQSVISESGSLEGTGYDGDDLDAIIADLGNGVLDTSGPQQPDGAPRERRSHICPSCGHEFED